MASKTKGQEQRGKVEPTPTAQPSTTNVGVDDKTPWQKAAEAYRDMAKEYRDYAASPVTIDTSGQKDYLHEFLESQTAKDYEEDQEEAPKRESRERTARRINAIADGLIGLTNIIGAANGATPYKQTSLSAAHKQAVDNAAKWRKERAALFETAHNNALLLQQKQDQYNASRMDAERKARQKAAKYADDLEGKALNMENTDRKFGLDKQKEIAREGENQQRLALQMKRLSTSSYKRGGKSGNGNDNSSWDERAAWQRAYPDEVKKLDEENSRIDPYTGKPTKEVSKNTRDNVNAMMRNRHGVQPKRGKKKSPVI